MNTNNEQIEGSDIELLNNMRTNDSIYSLCVIWLNRKNIRAGFPLNKERVLIASEYQIAQRKKEREANE
jgi:hypothetical protein